MKKIFYILCLIATPLFFQACDNLDLAPIDYAGSGNYWQNEVQVEGFMVGLHDDLREALYKNTMYYGEFRGETMSTRTNTCGSASNVANYIVNSISEDTPLQTNWGGFYSRILQVNHMIENLENGCSFLNDNSRNYYKGIAYGLRAYYYFWLYRSYGGVPLELGVKVSSGNINAPDLYLERATAKATMAQIKQDVETSYNNFKQTTKQRPNYYYWSKDATLMLKAEIYLWAAKVTTDDKKEPHTATGTADLQTAKGALGELTGYSLSSDFASLFQHSGKLHNDEVILALYFDKDEKVDRDWYRRYYYHSNFNGNAMMDEDGNDLGDALNLFGEGLLNHEYKETFVKSFDKTDSRRAGTFFEYYRKSDGLFGCNMLKFYGQNVETTHYFDADIILYRYADAILMMAEIENSLNGKCAAYINQIRQRAYGENYDSNLAYEDKSFAENELAILKERDKEFVSEGKRWFDLLRLQDASKRPLVFSADAAYANDDMEAEAVLDYATESYKVLWPIERSLMTYDPLLKQTVNYPTKEND